MTRFLLVALALVVAACAPRESDVMTNDDDMMMEDNQMAAPAVTAEGTLSAAQSAGGLTRLAPSAAVSNIDGWIARLEGDSANAPIVANLRTLRSQLQAPTLDGMAIAETLSELGEQTTAAAGGDASVRRLGQALSEASSMLMSM